MTEDARVRMICVEGVVRLWKRGALTADHALRVIGAYIDDARHDTHEFELDCPVCARLADPEFIAAVTSDAPA